MRSGSKPGVMALGRKCSSGTQTSLTQTASVSCNRVICSFEWGALPLLQVLNGVIAFPSRCQLPPSFRKMFSVWVAVHPVAAPAWFLSRQHLSPRPSLPFLAGPTASPNATPLAQRPPSHQMALFVTLPLHPLHTTAAATGLPNDHALVKRRFFCLPTLFNNHCLVKRRNNAGRWLLWGVVPHKPVSWRHTLPMHLHKMEPGSVGGNLVGAANRGTDKEIVGGVSGPSCKCPP